MIRLPLSLSARFGSRREKSQIQTLDCEQPVLPMMCVS